MSIRRHSVVPHALWQARQGFGPKGLEDSAVDALVRKVGNEVGETSTDSD